MGVTRYYFQNGTPALSPAYSTGTNGWVLAPTGDRFHITTAQSVWNGGSRGFNATGQPTVAWGQGVGAPLAAGELSGTFRLILRTTQSHSAADHDTYLRVVAKVVTSTGALRGLLCDLTGPTDFTQTTYAARTVEGPITPVTAEAGDRLVVEIGVRALSRIANITRTAQCSGGTTLATGDLPFAEVANPSANLYPWFEIQTVDPPLPPANLRQTGATTTATDVAWDAPAPSSTAPEPTSYQLRVDGGAPVDTGLARTRTLTGLVAGGTYTVEVRSVAGTLTSAWVPLVVTTLDPAPPTKPWLVSQQLLARAERDPEADQPAFQWHNHAGGWALDDLRSRALMGWTITTGRPGPRDRVAPAVVTVTLAAWGEYAAADLPQLGHRFRLALSPLLTAAGIAAGDLPRFTGEVTDVDLDPHTQVLTVTGVGRYARQGRLPVDGTGWPTEREGARVARILSAIGAAAGTLDAGRVELAPHVAAGEADQLIAQVSDSTTGQLVERRDGALDWHSTERRRDTPTALTLDAAELLRGFRWSQRVGDLTNTAAVKYAGGEVVVEDTASRAERGAYPISLDTLLVRAWQAQAIGGLVVGRYGRPVWLLPAVMVDLIRTLDPAELGAGVALQHGHKVQLTGLPAGGPYAERGAFVEGVTETLTPRAWRLTVTVADERLSGAPIRWRDVPADVSWTDVRDDLRWLDVATIQDPADLT